MKERVIYKMAIYDLFTFKGMPFKILYTARFESLWKENIITVHDRHVKNSLHVEDCIA